MKDSRERFTEAADRYRRYRPTYPAELVDWILRTAALSPSARIVDVGCGTGISTRLFAGRGYSVMGIDPNEEMLAHARAEGEADYLRGEAAATGLPAGSVDLIVAAQAFHWFDLSQVLPELRRILRPGGACVAFWNLWATTPFRTEYDALLKRFSGEYRELTRPADTIRAIREWPGLAGVSEAEFPNRQLLDRESFFGRVYSSSYVVHGVEDREAFDRALSEIFDRHQAAGRLEFLYRSVGILWRFSPEGGTLPS